MDLPPYDAYAPCPKCARTLGRSEKPLAAYCAGATPAPVAPGAPARPPTPCELGGDVEHIHRRCHDCGYQWAEACVGEPALTQAELRLFRDLIAR